ncbi:hypothetical protein K435DRAFT_846039 [Dendrothele bispora CBS 962.96]|uniref:Uncharacterized protein n=1 Tax=Dendrothele bispora (strain CBS 962.96) TaxID=1314807 RepID=A0A4V4HB31_DENBC|nr:hypothetical protein K435DRAFT_846039 [Dendrothele bispora CBS 962.96]
MSTHIRILVRHRLKSNRRMNNSYCAITTTADQLTLNEILRARVSRAVKYQALRITWKAESVASEQKGMKSTKGMNMRNWKTYYRVECWIFIKVNERICGPSGRRSSVSVKNGLRVPVLIKEGKEKDNVEVKSKRKGTRKSQETDEMSVEKGLKRI